MMKAIVEKDIGGDGAKAGLYMDEQFISVELKYPTAKLVEPITKVADSAIDKLEELIPGDQKAYAAKLKEQVRQEIAKIFAEQVAKL